MATNYASTKWKVPRRKESRSTYHSHLIAAPAIEHKFGCFHLTCFRKIPEKIVYLCNTNPKTDSLHQPLEGAGVPCQPAISIAEELCLLNPRLGTYQLERNQPLKGSLEYCKVQTENSPTGYQTEKIYSRVRCAERERREERERVAKLVCNLSCCPRH